jgi:hypothetical protein
MLPLPQFFLSSIFFKFLPVDDHRGFSAVRLSSVRLDSTRLALSTRHCPPQLKIQPLEELEER